MNHTGIPLEKQNALKRILAVVIADVNLHHASGAGACSLEYYAIARLNASFRETPDEGIYFIVGQIQEELAGYIGNPSSPVDAMLEFLEGMLALRKMLREMKGDCFYGTE